MSDTSDWNAMRDIVDVLQRAYGLRLVLHAAGTGEYSDQAQGCPTSDEWHAEFRWPGNDALCGGRGHSAVAAVVQAAALAYEMLERPTGHAAREPADAFPW